MPSLPDRELSRALLIGTSRFQHLLDLPAVRNNLTDLRATLIDPVHGIVAPDNCEIVDGPNSPHDFMTRLKHVIRRTDDFLFVYYAGHGLRNDAGDRLYLTVSHTEPDALDTSAVRFDLVKEALEDSPARTRLLVLDCCYSGMAAGIMSDGAVSRWEIQVRGSAVMASSPRNRTSHSPEGHRHTAFTGKMIDLLSKGSPIKDEPLTVRALYDRVSVALAREQRPEPKLALTETSGDLLLRRFKPLVIRPAPAPEPSTVRDLPPAPRSPQIPRPLSPRPTPLVTVRSNDLPVSTRSVPTRIEVLSKLIVLRVFWALSALWSIMWGGALVGVLFADNSGDGEYFGIGLLLAAVTGLPLGILSWKWRRLRQLVGPPLLPRYRVGRVLLMIGIAFGTLLAVMSLSMDTITETTRGSEVTGRTAVFLVGAELAAACAYLLARGHRTQHSARPR